jgi:hypothetical protein
MMHTHRDASLYTGSSIIERYAEKYPREALGCNVSTLDDVDYWYLQDGLFWFGIELEYWCSR